MRLSKITIPRRPPDIVERPRVRRALEAPGGAHGSCPVLLVSAPAGHGKTVAVADWVRTSPAVPTAWVSLDASDRDGTRWWRSVLGALRACPEVPADSVLQELEPAAEDGPARGAYLATLLDAVDALPVPVRLVLDDVHEIVGHPAEEGLRDLVRYPVRGLALVLCSRYDPPIGLDRLRLDARLGEVRVDRLAFTAEDTARLFAQASLDLSPDQVRSLVQRTEGWAAALRLLARSLQTAPDPASVVRDFAGDDRSVADYVVDEVLCRFSDRERRLVEAASACSPIPVDLAVALTGDAQAATTLERVEATTSMVTAIDRRREQFHTHELLRSHVVARLRRTRWQHLRGLYERAARWYEGRDDPAAALHYAALAGDVAGTEALLRGRAVELLARGALEGLEESDRLLGTRGDDHRARMVLALAALERDDAEHACALAEGTGEARDDDDADATVRALLRARLALAGGRPREARAAATDIDPDAVEGDPLRVLALTGRASASVTADPLGARADAEEALALGERHGWSYVVTQARSVLALVHAHRDELHTAVEHAHAVLEAAAREGWRDTPWATGALVVLAGADVLGGRPEHALAGVARAETATAPRHLAHRHALEVCRATAEYDTGRRLDGWHRLRALRARQPAGDLEVRQVAVAALAEQDMALRLGRTREAVEVRRAVAATLDGTGDGVVLQAREVWATTGDPATRRVVGPALDGSHPFVTASAAIEALVLDAEVTLAQGTHPVVRRRLQDALARAAELDVVRPLLQAAPALRRYLDERRGSFGDLEDVVDRVLSAGVAAAERPVVPLTEREREVLELLPSMRSVVEIAEDLAVSANTVKTHQRAIYHKLGADNRRAAVLRARRVGLLSGR